LKRTSIGFRLAAWYSLVLAAGLAVFSVAAWFGMRASLFHAYDDELRDRVKGVQKFMDMQISALSVSEIRDEFREHSVLGPGGDLFQVCNEQGEWLYRSVPLENGNVPIEKPSQLESPRFETLSVAGRPLRFYSQRIVVDGQPYTVQVASPLHEALEAMNAFALMLVFAVPVLLAIAMAGGYWLSKRALDPVGQIASAAQRISIENLAERLPVANTGDQLQRLSQTLNQMFSRLESSVRGIKQFTADASHELRAPIALIRTTAEVAVQNRKREAGEYLAALDDVLAESERTSQVVESLMLLARADAEKEPIERAPVDLCNTVRVAAEQGEKLARSRHVQFSAHVPPGPLRICADAEAIRRAVLVLIDNAVKYSNPGGHVSASVGVDGTDAVVSVADTGMGISPEDLPHIFDRFWRADKARSRSHGGAGLGLSIARWIADVHRGSIEVESTVGQGSVFRLRIPLLNQTIPEP
jgi:heavy metal sensor kinase